MALLGIDEVGRGPLAGPLVVGAVILPEEKTGWMEELKDSKKLSVKKREELNKIILKEATTGLGWVFAGEIDKIGMIQALRLATKRAVREIQSLHVPFSQVVIDGNLNFLQGTKLESYATTLIKGDDLVKEISAASIIAKQARDGYMHEIAKEYPEYGFDRHVGYGTALHREKIEEIGLCPEHRRIVKLVRAIAEEEGEDLNKIWERETKKNTTETGWLGENVVSEYLRKEGHLIVARNFKTKFSEIDIISVCEENIYFTEVKYRKTDFAGGGLEAITTEKQRKMKFAAECFMKFRKEFGELNPLLAVAEVSGEKFEMKDWFALV